MQLLWLCGAVGSKNPLGLAGFIFIYPIISYSSIHSYAGTSHMTRLYRTHKHGQLTWWKIEPESFTFFHHAVSGKLNRIWVLFFREKQTSLRVNFPGKLNQFSSFITHAISVILNASILSFFVPDNGKLYTEIQVLI